jgi:hypothetical protein
MKRVWISGLVLALALALLHAQILTGIATFMTIRDPLERADLILPLYHDGDTVPFAAAELYRRGYARQVAVWRTRPTRLEALGLLPPPHEIWRRVLEAEGVPPEAIVVIGSKIVTEVEPAGDVAAFLRSREKARVIVVASAPLSRLSRHHLRRGLTGSPIELRMYPVWPREFDERTWWRSRRGWITYFDIYCLWLLRFLRE